MNEFLQDPHHSQFLETKQWPMDTCRFCGTWESEGKGFSAVALGLERLILGNYGGPVLALFAVKTSLYATAQLSSLPDQRPDIRLPKATYGA